MKANTYNLNPEIIHSRAWKSQEMQKAQEALEKAKSLNRPCRRALSSECEFSRTLQPVENKEKHEQGLLSSKEAAKYVGMKLHTFHVRVKEVDIPYTLFNKRNKMFSKEDLNDNMEHFKLKWRK